MNRSQLKILRHLFFFLSLLLSLPQLVFSAPIVIAKDGAGQDFIENSLEALPLALQDGADFIELKVAMTKDKELLVFKDLTLNRLTDVADRFAERHREDGGFYVADFTLTEIRQLRLQNAFDNGPGSLRLPIPTLQEEIAVVMHLEKKLDRLTGLVIEPTYPEFYQSEGLDIVATLLSQLANSPVLGGGRQVYLQSFDADELQRCRESLFAQHNIILPLIQLLEPHQENQDQTADSQDNSWIFTNSGLYLAAMYASYIGIPGEALIHSDGSTDLTSFLQEAHAKGINILATSLPELTTGGQQQPLQQQLDALFERAGVDGIYTDDFRAVQKYQELEQPQVQTQETSSTSQEPQSDLPPFFSSLNLTRQKHIEPEDVKANEE